MPSYPTHFPATVQPAGLRWLALVCLTHLAIGILILGASSPPSVLSPAAEMTVSLLPENSKPAPSTPHLRQKTLPKPVTPTEATPTVQPPSPHAVQLPPHPSASAPSSATLSTPSTPTISAPRFDAAYLNNPPPAYPPLSRRMGEQGRVILLVSVGADGLPSAISIAKSSTSQRLDDAAINAVWKWKFVAAQQNGQPTSASVNVPIVFKLD